MNEGMNVQRKVQIEGEEREIVSDELVAIEEVLQALGGGDINYAYADTSDSMETLDSMLGDDPAYKETLQFRKEASEKIMSIDKKSKEEGLKQAKAWAEKVRKLL